MRNLAASYLLWLNLNVTSGSLSAASFKLATSLYTVLSTKPYCKLLKLQSLNFVRVFCEVEDIR